MKRALQMILLLMIMPCAVLRASGNSVSLQLGYAPEIGGSMHTGWQYENMGNSDGINDINRSDGTGSTATVEKPVGAVLSLGYRSFGEGIYFKTGISGVYSIYGGKGKTLNQAGTEVVDVKYTMMWGEIPFILGIHMEFWKEIRLSLGAGFAFAYGLYMNSFSSATIDNSAMFLGYGFPLIAEFSCEYRLSETVDYIATVQYMRGESRLIENGGDYTRLDFTSFRLLLGLTRRFGF